MKDIDFLPVRYRERTALRRARLWRALMVCCLAGFVVAVAVAQRAQQRPIEQQLAKLQALYPAAVATTARMDDLQKQLNDLNQVAALASYLRHPWPATQLLANLSHGLPDSVVLEELTVDRQPVGRTPPPPSTGQPAAKTAGLEAAAKRDLERLRLSVDAMTPSVHVTGMTTDVAAFQRYVRALAPSPLFAAARVEALEAVTSASRVEGSRFQLRLLIRPGFGQPGGPVQPLPYSTSPLVSQAIP